MFFLINFSNDIKNIYIDVHYVYTQYAAYICFMERLFLAETLQASSLKRKNLMSLASFHPLFGLALSSADTFWERLQPSLT